LVRQKHAADFVGFCWKCANRNPPKISAKLYSLDQGAYI
jgi:hypothetical protein